MKVIKYWKLFIQVEIKAINIHAYTGCVCMSIWIHNKYQRETDEKLSSEH